MEDKNFEYDSDVDSLYIYNSDGSESIKGSIVVNSLIFDIGVTGKALGVEIENASEFLNIPKIALNQIKDAKLKVITKGNILYLCFLVDSGMKIYNFNYMIPQSKISLTC